MEAGNISRISANLNYESHKLSSSIKSSYGNNQGSSKVDKEASFNAVLTNFKLQVSSNTYDSLNTQGDILERLGIGTSSKNKESSLFSSNVQTPDNDLFGEDGYWGVNKTAGRISEFVISGAGDDIEKLKAGREGIQRGLKDAEKVWGGKMPDIAYQTIEKSLEAIDEKIKKLGGNVVDITA